MRLLLAAIVGLAAGATAQPESPPEQPSTPPAEPTFADAWADRLEALRPDDPEAYFLLGEEVADVASTPDEIGLARHLFVVAFELDRARGGAPGIGGSVCLALADIERLDSRKAWLRALAGAIDTRYAAREWFRPAGVALDDDLALQVAEVLGYARAGEGTQARRLLDQEGVRRVLERYEGLLGNTGLSGGLDRLERYISAWPCPECGNERIVPRQGTNPVRYRLCYTCEGNPGPKLDPAELISHLRFESRLLSGLQRSWAAQVAADLGEPLRDPDPEDLAFVLDVDASTVYWRDGAWTASPPAP